MELQELIQEEDEDDFGRSIDDKIELPMIPIEEPKKGLNRKNSNQSNFEPNMSVVKEAMPEAEESR